MVLDIGTEAVKSLIFKKKNQKYIILGASRQYFSQFEVSGLEKAILRAIEESKSQAKVEPGVVFLGLPADIFKSRIVYQLYKRQKFKENIKEKEERGISQFILDEARRKAALLASKESGILPEDIQFINSEILAIKIDGYEVPYLRSYRGENLEFKIFFSFLPKHYFQNFKKIIEDLNLGSVKILQEAQNLMKVFRSDNALLIDVGGEVTQLFFIKNGELMAINEFSVGGKDFSRTLSQIFGFTEERAREFKERYSLGLMQEETRERIREILSAVTKEWFSCLKSKMASQKSFFTSTIFLFGGGSELPEIEETLKEEGFSVKFLYPKDFKNIIDTTHTLDSPKDINSLLFYFV